MIAIRVLECTVFGCTMVPIMWYVDEIVSKMWPIFLVFLSIWWKLTMTCELDLSCLSITEKPVHIKVIYQGISCLTFTDKPHAHQGDYLIHKDFYVYHLQASLLLGKGECEAE